MILSLLPIFIFLSIFLGSGIYFHMMNVESAFYQISPAVAILPAVFFAVVTQKGTINNKINSVINGIRHKDIITMIIIFLLAGAFSSITTSIGCVDSTVQLMLNFFPTKILLISIFLIASFLSLAIGSSMGTVATITPFAIGIAKKTMLPLDLTIGIVVSGAMFGDNLSFISDTTIAAVQSQHTNLKDKFNFNAPIACIAAIIMVLALLFLTNPEAHIETQSFSYVKIIPYLTIIVLALLKFHVFSVLSIGIITATIIGFIFSDYNFLKTSKDISQGFNQMSELVFLVLFLAGLTGLLKDQGAIDLIIKKIETVLKNCKQKTAELFIGLIVSIADLLTANNTIAILVTGEIAKNISKKHNIKPYKVATFLDIFSCVFQGILPYGAQILLASSLSGVSPLLISLNVYYCFILGIVSVLFILLSNRQNF